MEGTDGEGGPPIPALITNYVESLWVLLVSAMGSYDASYRQNTGGGARPARRPENRPKILATLRSLLRKSDGG